MTNPLLKAIGQLVREIKSLNRRVSALEKNANAARLIPFDGDWSKVSDEDLYAEVGRRRQAARTSYGGGVPPSCTCGECFKCRRRLAMQRYRAKVKKAAR